MRNQCPACECNVLPSLTYPANYRAQENIFLRHESISQHLHRCKNCGLILSCRVLPPDFYFEYINSFYENGTYPTTAAEIDNIESFYRTKHRFIRQFLDEFSDSSKRQRLLEVSSYYGTGLFDLSDRFDVYGVEAENAPSLFAAQHYPPLRGRIINDVLENSLDTLAAQVPFDFILFMFAFRQIAYPEKVMENLQRIIAPGGYVVVAEGVLSDYIFAEKPELASRHFYHNKSCYYNIKNLTILFAKYGLSYVTTGFLGQAEGRAFDQSLVVFKNTGVAVQPSGDQLKQAKESSELIFEHFLQSIPA